MPEPFTTVYLNGEFLDRKDAKISPDDRGFLLGDGVFDTLRSYNGAFFRFDAHFRRLSASLRSLRIEASITSAGLQSIFNELLLRNDEKNAIARVTVSRGEGLGGFRVNPHAPPTVYASLRSVPDCSRIREEGIVLSISTATRPSGFFHERDSAGEIIKTTSIGPMAAARYLSSSDEIVMLDAEGNLTEGATSSIFVVSEDSISAPSLERVLPGITRQVLSEIVTVNVRPIAREELLRAGAIIVASSSTGPIAASRIDDHELDVKHPLIKRITDGYDSTVRAECGIDVKHALAR